MAIDQEVADAINLLWIFVAGIMCFLLQAGFGLLEAGSVRAKNAQNIMIKNLMDGAVAALAYWACGYAFAYGGGGNSFIGTGADYFFLNGTEDYIGWFFQYVFAGTTATIVSGAVAERCQFQAYMIYSVFLSGFMYPVVSHWIWSPDGFLAGKVLDFAGGGAVHGVGGAAALAGAWILGPRKGRFLTNPETGKIEVVRIPPHNMVLATLGGFILWFGFFPFNGGSGLNIVGEGAVITGRVAVVTTLSGAMGGVTMIFFGRWKEGHWDLSLALNGILAGMICSCSGVNVYALPYSLLVGFTGAFAYYAQEWVTIHVFHIDDPLSAAALHMGAGFWGVLLAGLVANEDYAGEGMGGWFTSGNAKQFAYQIYAVVVYFGWAFGTSSMCFFTLNYFNMFRVPEEEELEGLDMTHHGGSAYHVDKLISRDNEVMTEREVGNESEESDGVKSSEE